MVDTDTMASAERVAIFIDYHNVENSLRRAGLRVDMTELVDYVLADRALLECFCYIGSHPQPEYWSESQARIRSLQLNGYLVTTKMGQVLPGGQLKCDFDVEIALDAAEYVRASRPDSVVLATGDGHFCPLARRLRRQGVRVEVASMAGSISNDLRASANGFIDLAQLAQEVEHLPLPELTPEDPADPSGHAAPQAEPVVKSE